MDILALVGEAARERSSSPRRAAAKSRTPSAFQINVFWIVVAATDVRRSSSSSIRAFAFSGIAKTLEERRARIEQGLKDAEQAAKDRAAAEEERITALQEARREANEILNRAQKVARRDPRSGHRGHRATRSTGSASARPPRSRPRSSRRSRSSAPRSPTSRSPRPQGGRRIARRHPPAQARPGLPRESGRRARRLEGLMARPSPPRDAMPRRPSRSPSATTRSTRWRDDLALAAEIAGRPRRRADRGQPPVPLRSGRTSSSSCSASASRPRACGSCDLLVSRGARGLLPRVADEYKRLLNQHRGIVPAVVTSAVAAHRGRDQGDPRTRSRRWPAPPSTSAPRSTQRSSAD